MTEQRAAGHTSSSLDRQFGHPTGALGRLVGYAMALEHRALHRAAVDRLELRPADEVLEIGFGPGTAIRLAAARAAFVAGVEVSEVMKRQAERRNRVALREGRIELRLASATALPYPDARFSVVFEVNSLHHWEDRRRGLAEAHRVLRAQGRLLVTVRQTRRDTTDDEVAQVTGLLTGVGFEGVVVERHRIGHGGAFVMARR
jgi:ubiquinone/menaquinone biosynthesis C-methylase UbiE